MTSSQVSWIHFPLIHSLHHIHSGIFKYANFIRLPSFLRIFPWRKTSLMWITKICESGLPLHLCPYIVPDFPSDSWHQPHIGYRPSAMLAPIRLFAYRLWLTIFQISAKSSPLRSPMPLLCKVTAPLFVNPVKTAILYLCTKYLNNTSPQLGFKLQEGRASCSCTQHISLVFSS